MVALNLHAIVSNAIGSINPPIPATIRSSAGYTIDSDGTQVPLYTDVCATIQVQSLSNDELKQVDGLNIQGNKNAVYLSGNWNGIVRVGKQGGDLLLFGGQTWLAVIVLENWPRWTKLAVVLQNGG